MNKSVNSNSPSHTVPESPLIDMEDDLDSETYERLPSSPLKNKDSHVSTSSNSGT
jgi:hypothetical protein